MRDCASVLLTSAVARSRTFGAHVLGGIAHLARVAERQFGAGASVLHRSYLIALRAPSVTKG